MDVATNHARPSTQHVAATAPIAGDLSPPAPAADGVSLTDHVARVLIWMAITAGVLLWTLRHSEAHLRDGLRSIEQAQRIDAGSWREGLLGGLDHPLHPLGIVAFHKLIGGEGPEWWQRAAVALGFASIILLTIPVYLLGRELLGDRAAWIACALLPANPVIGSTVVNAISESTFLLIWTWGLWAAVKYLRDGRFLWLPPALGFGALAFLVRTEGLLLPASILATLALVPLRPSTRINWPRWWAAVAFVAVGSVAAVGPYMAAKGKLLSRPGVARVLGLEAQSAANALEREAPLSAAQTTAQTYRLAAVRAVEALGANIPMALLAAAVLGIFAARDGSIPVRTWLFLGIVFSASILALIRLYATAGYCSPRNALVPGLLLMLAAAKGLDWLMKTVSFDGRWLGLPGERIRPGAAVWALAVVPLILLPRIGEPVISTPGPFNVYWDAGIWLSSDEGQAGKPLDLTDWSLYFSRREGLNFADLPHAAGDPDVRWVVALASQVDEPSTYAATLRNLIGDRPPVVAIPGDPKPGQIQIRVYERVAPITQTAQQPDAGAIR